MHISNPVAWFDEFHPKLAVSLIRFKAFYLLPRLAGM
jgi:hypothetical protein